MDGGLGSIADDFNRLAVRYFGLFVSSPIDKIAWLEEVEVAVAELYAVALRLPITEPSDQDAPEMSAEDRSRLWTRVVEQVGRDGIFYSFVFHPLDPTEKPVGSTLAEDLESIYVDLYGGVELLAAGGTHEDVIWAWRLSFQTHWGRHALGALQVMNALVR